MLRWSTGNAQVCCTCLVITALYCPVTCYRSVRDKSLFIDCSTIDQSTVTEIAKKTIDLGGDYLDSPVSGGKVSMTIELTPLLGF